jgi:hypothetical protein
MFKEVKNKTNTKVNPSLSQKYNGQIIFKEKFEWAVNHVKGRDIVKEIAEAIKQEKTQ